MILSFEEDPARVKYCFDQGRIHCFAHEADTDIVETEVIKAEYQPFNDLRILLDRGEIIYNWLKGHTDEFDYHYL